MKDIDDIETILWAVACVFGLGFLAGSGSVIWAAILMALVIVVLIIIMLAPRTRND